MADPTFDSSIQGHLSNLVTDFPGLVLTGGTRTKEQQEKYIEKGIGAKNSKHLYGKAADFRINSAARQIAKLPKDKLKKYGIEDAFIHANHLHIEWA